MKKVLVVGLTSIDVINFCEHFPAEDEDMRVALQKWLTGGNAANTSVVLAQHENIQVDLLSCLSGKSECKFVMDQLHDSGINIDLCPIYNNIYLPTSSCIINKENGSRTILHYSNNFPSLKMEDLLKADINSYDWIHFEGRDFPEVGKMIDYVLEFRKSVDKPIVSGELEKVKRLADLEKYMLTKVDVLFVSKDIAKSKSFISAMETVDKLSFVTGMKAMCIICPWGDAGAACAEKCPSGDQYNYYQCPAKKIDCVLDTLGAGDTFIAGAIYSIINKADMQSVIEYSCDLAGRKCEQYGLKDIFHTTI